MWRGMNLMFSTAQRRFSLNINPLFWWKFQAYPMAYLRKQRHQLIFCGIKDIGLFMYLGRGWITGRVQLAWRIFFSFIRQVYINLYYRLCLYKGIVPLR